MNNNNSLDSIKELLNVAINKNQVTFSHVAKIAENVGSGLLKVKLNESGKSVDFEYMNKKISIDLNRFRINGVKYLIHFCCSLLTLHVLLIHPQCFLNSL